MQGMKVKEIQENREIMQGLRWDLTPQTGNISGYVITCQEDLTRLNKMLAEKAGYYFYVDVWNCQARLALMYNNPDGGGR